MSFERGDRSEAPATSADVAASAAPGKRSRVDGAVVQRRENDAATSSAPVQLLPGPAPAHEDPFAVHQLAERGVSGGAGAMPHHDAIQRSFGRHDISGVQAHTDRSASSATRAMGAEAFASGNHVAFADTPSLHTAAHEAAHVVQQRGGVQLKGGVGEVGDTYERHADEVADAVVAGRSAEALLDRHAPAGGATPSSANGVQMYIAIGRIGKGKKLKSVDEAWDGMMRECESTGDPSKVLPQLQQREAAARATLAEWLASSGELATNAREYLSAVTTGEMSEQPAQWRQYRDCYELAVAVAYETHPQTVANKEYEGQLAAFVANDAAINAGLNFVKQKILDALHAKCEEKFKAFESEVDGSAWFSAGKVRGSYRQIGSYKDGGMKLNVVDFLHKLSESFETNIAVIHDMMEHLSGEGGGAKFPTSLGGDDPQLPEPRDAAYETTLLNDDHTALERRTRRTEAGEIDRKRMKGRNNVGTRDVKDIDTITGMMMNAPMLAGKSMTTARMMELVDWAGGNQWDRIVVAWAIFAYWKHNYPASTVPFHTFHEVMDIAKNYGVPYRPFFYPDLERGPIDYTSAGTKPFNDKAQQLG